MSHKEKEGRKEKEIQKKKDKERPQAIVNGKISVNTEAGKGLNGIVRIVGCQDVKQQTELDPKEACVLKILPIKGLDTFNLDKCLQSSFRIMPELYISSCLADEKYTKHLSFYRRVTLDEQNNINLLMSFANHNSLNWFWFSSFFRERISYSGKLRLLQKFTNELITALEWLHEHHMGHYDIKPDNIFVSTDLNDASDSRLFLSSEIDTPFTPTEEELMIAQTHVILGDFGLSFHDYSIPYVSGDRVFSSAYRPPVLDNNRQRVYTKETDWWALGFTLLTILAKTVFLEAKRKFTKIDSPKHPNMTVLYNLCHANKHKGNDMFFKMMQLANIEEAKPKGNFQLQEDCKDLFDAHLETYSTLIEQYREMLDRGNTLKEPEQAFPIRTIGIAPSIQPLVQYLVLHVLINPRFADARDAYWVSRSIVATISFLNSLLFKNEMLQFNGDKDKIDSMPNKLVAHWTMKTGRNDKKGKDESEDFADLEIYALCLYACLSLFSNKEITSQLGSTLWAQFLDSPQKGVLFYGLACSLFYPQLGTIEYE